MRGAGAGDVAINYHYMHRSVHSERAVGKREREIAHEWGGGAERTCLRETNERERERKSVRERERTQKRQRSRKRR